jgi:hypothetical protein
MFCQAEVEIDIPSPARRTFHIILESSLELGADSISRRSAAFLLAFVREFLIKSRQIAFASGWSIVSICRRMFGSKVSISLPPFFTLIPKSGSKVNYIIIHREIMFPDTKPSLEVVCHSMVFDYHTHDKNMSLDD